MYEVFESNPSCAISYKIGACYDEDTAPTDDPTSAHGVCCLSGYLGAGQKCLRYSATDRYKLYSSYGALTFYSGVNVTVSNGAKSGSAIVTGDSGETFIPGVGAQVRKKTHTHNRAPP
jgi:hypothetical protein